MVPEGPTEQFLPCQELMIILDHSSALSVCLKMTKFENCCISRLLEKYSSHLTHFLFVYSGHTFSCELIEGHVSFQYYEFLVTARA